MSGTLLPMAERAGARVQSGCRVRSLLRHGDRITGALVDAQLPDGERQLVRINADHVFVCAGPTETAALLRRSGIKYRVGDSLRIHPMLKVVAKFRDVVHADKSVLPLLQVLQFSPDMHLGGAFFSRGHLAMSLSDNWDVLSDRMKDADRMATYYVAVRGRGRGTVRPSVWNDADTNLRYELTDEDTRNLSSGFARLATLLLAAGAEEVYPSIQKLPSVSRELDAIRWMDESLPRAAMSLTTVHAFSTCPTGERSDRTAADSFGKVRRFANLYVNDASILPDSPGVNPQGSVMALARRNALHFHQTVS